MLYCIIFNSWETSTLDISIRMFQNCTVYHLVYCIRKQCFGSGWVIVETSSCVLLQLPQLLIGMIFAQWLIQYFLIFQFIQNGKYEYEQLPYIGFFTLFYNISKVRAKLKWSNRPAQRRKWHEAWQFRCFQRAEFCFSDSQLWIDSYILLE